MATGLLGNPEVVVEMVGGTMKYVALEDHVGKTITYECGVHPSMVGQILVGPGAEEVELIVEVVYEWQAIAHGVCMFLAFGFFLPSGAFLAKQGKRRLHMFCQPTGIVIAIVGFVFAIVSPPPALPPLYARARPSVDHCFVAC